MTLLQVDDSDAGTAQADILVAVACNTEHRAEVVAYNFTQDAISGAMKNSDAFGRKLHRIVNEVCHCLQRLVGPHAANINLRLERQLAGSDVF